MSALLSVASAPSFHFTSSACGDAAADLNDVADAGNGLGFVGVEARHLAAEHRTLHDARDQHARPLHVEAELGCAVDLRGDVETRQRLTEDLEVLGIFQRDVLWHRQRRGLVGQRAVFHATSTRPMDDFAFFRRQAVLEDVPGLRGGGDEHRARGRAGLAQDLPHPADAVAAGGQLRAAEIRVAELRIGRRPLVLDPAPVGVELFGEEHRHRRHDALAHLELRQHDRDVVIGANLYPDVRLEEARGSGRAVRSDQIREISTDDQPAARGGADLQKGSSVES
jgi:hypothetical protein